MRSGFFGAISIVVAISAALLAFQMSTLANANVIDGMEPDEPMGPPTTAREKRLPDTTTAIDMCTQHAPKCPLDEAVWMGEADAWQKTGKKWKWLSSTPSGRNVIWEWSMPYAGSNPAYAGQREDHYSDLTDAPHASPVFTTTDPYTYDWERWEAIEGNYLFHQYGWPSEDLAWHIGEFDCESGVIYPVIDHNVAYAYTPMSVLWDGQCVGGGYMSAHRAELWGEPLSPTRVSLCDNPTTGIPAVESPKGNAACKLSPHVGIVYQRYAVAPTELHQASVGCEAVLYAWGWTKPSQGGSGQDYETWFRNGELRFSRWLNLSDQLAGGLPPADDHEWWNSRCERAWSDMTNVLYTGTYKIGSTVYTDTIALPVTVAAEIPISGGHLTSTIDSVTYVFPQNTFTDTAIVSHTIRFQSDYMSPGHLGGVNRFYEVAASYLGAEQPAQPTSPYTITVQYSAAGVKPLVESTLALYSWDGSRWIKEPTSMVFTAANTVVATPDHFSLWALLGEKRRVYLPLITRHGP